MPNGPTADADYTARLSRLQNVWWKRVFDVQAPYRWNLRRLHLGRTLDIGCGIGRNLAYLPPGSVGVDHNPHSIEVARERGLKTFLPAEFSSAPHSKAGSFDSA
jgi:SAM-dependent methyltransferase